MNKKINQILFRGCLFVVLFDFIYSIIHFPEVGIYNAKRALFYLFLHIPFIFWLAILIVKDLKNIGSEFNNKDGKLKQSLLWGFLILILFNFTNFITDFHENGNFNLKKDLLYFTLHIPFILWFVTLIVNDIKNKNGLLNSLWIKVLRADIPKGLIYCTLIVMFGNLVSIAIGKPKYPFYDVGMFRWQTTFGEEPKMVYKVRYYYYKNGKPEIFDIRREGFIFFSKYFDITHSHVYTFSVNFHNKSRKETFDHLSTKLKEKGIDTLWVGVQTVNYETKKVHFDPDICRAIKVNNTQNIYYGPIYIPEYQIEKCQ